MQFKHIIYNIQCKYTIYIMLIQYHHSIIHIIHYILENNNNFQRSPQNMRTPNIQSTRMKQLQKRFHFNPQKSIHHISNVNVTKRKISDIIIKDQNGQFSSVKDKNQFNDSSWLARLVNGIQDNGNINSQGIEDRREAGDTRHGFTITKNQEQYTGRMLPRKSVPNMCSSNRYQYKAKEQSKLSFQSISSHKISQKPKKSQTKQSQKTLSQNSPNSNSPTPKPQKHKLTFNKKKPIQKSGQKKQKQAHKNSLINYSSIQEEDRNFQLQNKEQEDYGLDNLQIIERIEKKDKYQENIVIDLDTISLKTDGSKDMNIGDRKNGGRDGREEMGVKVNGKKDKEVRSHAKNRSNQENIMIDENIADAKIKANRKRTQSLKTSQIYKTNKVKQNQKKKSSGIIKANNSSLKLVESEQQKNKSDQLPNVLRQLNRENQQAPKSNEVQKQVQFMSKDKYQTKHSQQSTEKDHPIISSNNNTNANANTNFIKIQAQTQAQTRPLIQIRESETLVAPSRDQKQMIEKDKDIFSSWNQFMDTFKYQPVVEVRAGAIKKNKGKKSGDGLGRLDIKDIISGSFSDQARIPTFSERPAYELVRCETIQNTRECPTKKNSLTISSPLKNYPIRRQQVQQKSISTIKKGELSTNNINVNQRLSYDMGCQQFAKQSPKFHYSYGHSITTGKKSQHVKPETNLSLHSISNSMSNKHKRTNYQQLFKKLDKNNEKKIHKNNCNENILTEQQKYQIGSIISKIKYMNKIFTITEFVNQCVKLYANQNDQNFGNNNINGNGIKGNASQYGNGNVNGYHTFQPLQSQYKENVPFSNVGVFEKNRNIQRKDGQCMIRPNKKAGNVLTQNMYQFPSDTTFTPLFPETGQTRTQNLAPRRSPYLQKSSTAYISDQEHQQCPTSTPILAHLSQQNRHKNTLQLISRSKQKEKGDIGSIIDHLNSKLSNYIQHNNLEDTFKKFKLEFVQLRRNMQY